MRQTTFYHDKLEGAIQRLGGNLEQVVRNSDPSSETSADWGSHRPSSKWGAGFSGTNLQTPWFPKPN